MHSVSKQSAERTFFAESWEVMKLGLIPWKMAHSEDELGQPKKIVVQRILFIDSNASTERAGRFHNADV